MPKCLCGYRAESDEDLTEHILAMAVCDDDDHGEA